MIALPPTPMASLCREGLRGALADAMALELRDAAAQVTVLERRLAAARQEEARMRRALLRASHRLDAAARLMPAGDGAALAAAWRDEAAFAAGPDPQQWIPRRPIEETA
jgi:hypothetical protein